MLILSDGRVYLEKGEVVPVYCTFCKQPYQPEEGSEYSNCPKCGQENDHNEQLLDYSDCEGFEN